MFPRTTDFTEIWPQLLIKAFFKLYSYKWYPGAIYDRETGDCSLVYSLTGLIGERIKINDFHGDGMNTLRKHLSDEHYFNNKTYVMTYCGPTYKPKIPSQMSGVKSGFGGQSNPASPNTSITGSNIAISNLAKTSKQKLAMKLREIASLALSITSGKKLSQELLNRARQSYVITGFGYALMDIFENRNVDMDTIIKKPDNYDAKSPFASPSRAERRKRKNSPLSMTRAGSVMKKRKKKKFSTTLKNKTMSVNPMARKAPPIQYKLVKIKTSVGNYPIMNVNPPFTNTEIKLAKKCRLNKWENPPPELDPNFSPTRVGHKAQKDFKLEISPIKEERGKDTPADEDNKEEDEEVEKEKPVVYEPKTRAPGGIWLQAADFPFCFQYFIIFHNDEKLKNKKVHKNIWNNPAKPYRSNEEDIYIRLRDNTEEETKEEEELNPEAKVEAEDDPYKISEDIPHDNKKRMVVAFAPNPTAKAADKLPRYYCRVLEEQVETKEDEGKSVDNNIVLSTLINEDEQPPNEDSFLFPYYFSGQTLVLDVKAKFILKPHIYAPLGYCLWLSSDSKIDILTHKQYCIEEKQLYCKNYQVEQGNLQKGKYSILFKFDFIPTQSDTECEFKLKTEDKYLYEYMRFKIVDKACNDEGLASNGMPVSLNQRLVENSSITTLNSCKTEKITFQPNEKGYSLICETIPPYNVFALNLDLEMITNKEELELEKTEMVDPLVYSDTYKPYKYGIIFKEKIYVGQETSASFNIQLRKKYVTRTLKEPPVEEDEKSVDSKDNEKETPEKEDEYEETEEVKELNKIFKVEVFDNEQLISTYHGNGHLTISHFNFRSNNGLEDKPEDAKADDESKEEVVAEEALSSAEEKEYKHYYVIQATFDKNDWKEAILKEHEETNDITWSMRVFSSDTLAIVKDTDKEDKEQKLKDSWEAAEPGRAEKSQKSRMRYLIQLKQEKGEELTEEEAEILKEKRVRGAANLREAIPDPKAAKGKGDKKAPVAEEDEKVEEAPKEFPKSEQYTNLHFRNFIHHFEGDRLIHVKCEKASARLRDEREIEERKKQKEEEVKVWEEVFNTRLSNRELEAADRENNKKQMLDILAKSRKDFSDKTTELFNKRNEYRELISNRKHKEILLTDILNAEKIDIGALEQALNDAKDALVNKETLEKAEEKIEKLKYSKGVEEELQAATGEKNAEKMRELIAKIEQEMLIIEPKILNDSKNALAKIK